MNNAIFRLRSWASKRALILGYRLAPDVYARMWVDSFLAGEVERMRKALGQWDALIEELPSGEDGLTGKQVDRMCRIFNEARSRAALQGETK